MFCKVVALTVLVLWLALLGLGSADGSNLDIPIVPSIVALDSPNCGDDHDHHKLFDLAIPRLNLPNKIIDRATAKNAKILIENRALFQINCSFLC
jgi:hypothetical protein